jgi:hypothetical protein
MYQMMSSLVAPSIRRLDRGAAQPVFWATGLDVGVAGWIHGNAILAG